MTIDEAIKLLGKDIPDPRGVYMSNLNIAEELGIEALKREQQRRKYLINSTGELLPGETEK